MIMVEMRVIVQMMGNNGMMMISVITIWKRMKVGVQAGFVLGPR